LIPQVKKEELIRLNNQDYRSRDKIGHWKGKGGKLPESSPRGRRAIYERKKDLENDVSERP